MILKMNEKMSMSNIILWALKVSPLTEEEIFNNLNWVLFWQRKNQMKQIKDNKGRLNKLLKQEKN